jgi:hypothetical protein
LANKPKAYDHIAKDYRDLEKALAKYLNKWTKLLNLTAWHKEVAYLARTCNDDPNNGALIQTLWEYKSLTLRLYLPKIRADYGIEGCERLIVHELCHVLVCGMRDPNSKEQRFEERTVVELTEILLKLHK